MCITCIQVMFSLGKNLRKTRKPSLLKTGQLPAQWAVSSRGLTISIPGRKYMLNLLYDLLPLETGIQTYTANAIEQLPVSYTWNLIIIQTYAANYIEPLPSCALERITQQKTLTMYALVLSQHSTYCNRQLQTSSWKFHLINFVGSGPKIYFDRSMTPPLILQALERFVCFSRPSEIWKQLIIIIILFSESLIYLPSCFLMCHCFVFSSFLFTGLGWKGIQCFLQQLFILFFDYWKTMKQHL